MGISDLIISLPLIPKPAAVSSPPMGTPGGGSPKLSAEGLGSSPELGLCPEDSASPAEGRVVGHPDVLGNQA